MRNITLKGSHKERYLFVGDTHVATIELSELLIRHLSSSNHDLMCEKITENVLFQLEHYNFTSQEKRKIKYLIRIKV